MRLKTVCSAIWCIRQYLGVGNLTTDSSRNWTCKHFVSVRMFSLVFRNSRCQNLVSLCL